MKLFTREEIIEGFAKHGNMSKINAMNIIDVLTPIKLPSDEEIDLEGIGCYNGRLPYADGFINGAKWVIEKIKKQGK